MIYLIEKLFGEQEDDFKLFHMIERFSLDKSLVVSVSFSRIVADLLNFCYSVRDRSVVIHNTKSHAFG